MCNLKNHTTKDLIRAYITTRDQKAEIKARQEEELKPLNEALEMLEAEMHDRLKQAGVESFKTDVGTAYTKTLKSIKVVDRAAFMDFVKNGNIDLLDVRPNKTAVEEYIEQNQQLPQGLDITSVESVGFRR